MVAPPENSVPVPELRPLLDLHSVDAASRTIDRAQDQLSGAAIKLNLDRAVFRLDPDSYKKTIANTISK